MRHYCRVLAGSALVAALPLCGQSITAVTVAYPSTPVIQLTIIGSGFGNARPSVSLDGFSLAISSFTQTNVVALATATLSPGTYTLTLVNNSLTVPVGQRTASFPVSLGAVGPPGPQGLPGTSTPTTTGSTTNSGSGGTAPAKTSGSPPSWISAALPGPLVTPWTAASVTPDQAIAITRVTANLKTAGSCGPSELQITNGAAGENIFIPAAQTAFDSGVESIPLVAGQSLRVQVVQAASCGAGVSPADGNVLIQFTPTTSNATSCAAANTLCSGLCTATQVDMFNCGACGTACPTGPNAAASCTSGACSFACNSGFGNCDGNKANGCETNLTTINNCGTCGNACPTGSNASATCNSGTCGFACNFGFADCDHNLANGCEASLFTDNNNCGACGNVCAGVCSNGVCIQ